MQALVLLKMIAIGGLVYASSLSWVVLAPALGAAALGDCLTPEHEGDADPLPLPVHWLLALFVALLVGFLFGGFVPLLIASVLAWLLCRQLRTLPQTAPRPGRTVMELTETAVLVIGLLFTAA